MVKRSGPVFPCKGCGLAKGCGIFAQISRPSARDESSGVGQQTAGAKAVLPWGYYMVVGEQKENSGGSWVEHVSPRGVVLERCANFDNPDANQAASPDHGAATANQPPVDAAPQDVGRILS